MNSGCARLSRRAFLTSLSVGVAGVSAGVSFRAEDKQHRAERSSRPASGNPQTFTYKTVGDLEIKADVYRPTATGRCPVVLWIHGGALIRLDRTDVNHEIKKRFLNAGYAIVSIDYRLAPESKLPQIIEDLRDAYTWLHDQGPRLFDVDTSRIAVVGDSAGGYLTLTSGFAVRPRPTVLAAFWGYGDITADWYTKPSAFYRKGRLITKEEAWTSVGHAPLANGTKNALSRRRFYLYCRQQGLWTNYVSGFDPKTQDHLLTPYCPARNVTKEYPPTILVHGTDDTDVPYSQSVQMDHELTRAGVEHRFISVPHAGHDLSGGNPREVAAAYAAALAFAERHMKAV